MPRPRVGTTQQEDPAPPAVFKWETTLIAFPLLYALGWAFLLICTFLEQPPKLLYVLSALCFTLAVAWSLAALYTFDSLQKPRVRYPNNKSDSSGDVPRRRRRRRNKKARKLTAGLSILLYVVAISWLAVNFYKFLHPTVPETYEVFVRTTYKTRALGVPPREAPGDGTGMTFALVNIPIIHLDVGEGEKTTRLTLVIRNIGRRRAENVRIRIDTDGTVFPVGPDVARISPRELEVVVPNIAVYNGQDGEISIPLDVGAPQYHGSAGLLFTLESDDAKPYAAAVKVQMARQIQ